MVLHQYQHQHQHGCGSAFPVLLCSEVPCFLFGDHHQRLHYDDDHHDEDNDVGNDEDDGDDDDESQLTRWLCPAVPAVWVGPRHPHPS